MGGSRGSVPLLQPISLFEGFEFADPELVARKALLDGMVRPEAYALHGSPLGRPAWPVAMMVRIVLLQKEEGLGDRPMVDRLRYDRRLRWLVGLSPLGETPSRSALVDFRRYLLEARRERMAATQQREWMAANELVQPGDGLIIDATDQATAAAQPSVLGLLQHAMRRVVLLWQAQEPRAAALIVQRLDLHALAAERFNRSRLSVRRRQGQRCWKQHCLKAKALLRALPAEIGGALAAAASVLRRVIEERGPTGDLTPPDRITNAMDADARFGCKGKGGHRHTWQGYKITLLTHAQTDLILSVHVMAANHVDGDALQPALEALHPAHATLSRLDADGAYTDRDHRVEATQRGICLIGPRRTARRRGRVPGGGRVATREDRGRRCGVEKTHAHLVRWRHNRRCPYMGLRKAWLQSVFAVCAANLVRLLTLWREGRLVIAGLPPPARFA